MRSAAFCYDLHQLKAYTERWLARIHAPPPPQDRKVRLRPRWLRWRAWVAACRDSADQLRQAYATALLWSRSKELHCTVHWRHVAGERRKSQRLDACGAEWWPISPPKP